MVIFVLEQDSILLEMGAIKVALRASSFSTHQKCSSALLWGWPVRKAEDGTLCPCEKGGGSNNTCARLHSWSAAGWDFFAPSFCLGATRLETENKAVACSDWHRKLGFTGCSFQAGCHCWKQIRSAGHQVIPPISFHRPLLPAWHFFFTLHVPTVLQSQLQHLLEGHEEQPQMGEEVAQGWSEETFSCLSLGRRLGSARRPRACWPPGPGHWCWHIWAGWCSWQSNAWGSAGLHTCAASVPVSERLQGSSANPWCVGTFHTSRIALSARSRWERRGVRGSVEGSQAY